MQEKIETLQKEMSAHCVNYMGLSYVNELDGKVRSPTTIILGLDWFSKFANLFLVFGRPMPLPHPRRLVLEQYTACESFSCFPSHTPCEPFFSSPDGVLGVIHRNNRLLPSADDDYDPDDEFMVDEEDDTWKWQLQLQSTNKYLIPVYQEKVT